MCFIPFYKQNNILLHGDVTFCLPAHSFTEMDIWVSTLGLLGPVLLCTSMYTFLCGHVFLVILGWCFVLELLGQMLILGLTFWSTVKTFPKWPHHFTFLLVAGKNSTCPISLTTLGIIRVLSFSHSDGKSLFSSLLVFFLCLAVIL